MVAWNLPLPWLDSKVRKSMTNEMRLDQFVARLKFAPRLEGDGIYSLPPGRPAEVIHLDCLPGAPKDWIRSRGSYVVPVDVGLGIWFDWRNGDENDVNTAIVPSVKGMNPFTGQKLEALRLESYVEKCPVHAHPFKGPDRFCEKCGYEWPPQNYITCESIMWCDGFRQPSDGSVRQFFFSDEDKRDIASLVIGKENTVPAFGFGFWKPKNPRLVQQRLTRGCFGSGVTGQSLGFDSEQGPTGPIGSEGAMGFCGDSSVLYESSDHNSIVVYSTEVGANQMNDVSGSTLDVGETVRCYHQDDSLHMKAPETTKSARSKVATRSVSVGAGAKIHQDLAQDSLGLDGWNPETAAVIRLYFCFEEQFREIVAGGIRDVRGNKEGYLKGLPVG
jgi:hypothetical protein